MNKVGLIVFSESGVREDVYRQRKPLQDRETERLITALKYDIEFFIPSCGEIRGKKDVRSACAEMDASGVDSVLLFVPIFISASLVTLTARLISKPVAVMGNGAKDTFSQLAVLVSGGAIDQTGLSCKRISGDIDDLRTRSNLLSFVRASAAAMRLKGMTYGCIGGRSLGISPGTADPAQWMKLFGVDIEHIDQYEIVLRAEKASVERVEHFRRWIADNYGAVTFKEGRFDEDRLDRMIRSYLATRSIIDHYELDFLGVKCQPEMSNGYVLQCLNVQLLNDPYDADGPKEPIVCSCEADHDGALTMQIMKLLSGGQPTALQDILHVDDRGMVLANCGSTASYFANLSSSAKQNLSNVHLIAHGFGEAGGASTQFVVEAGEFTFARLYRKDGAYQMGVLRGKTESKPRDALNEWSYYRPTSFARVNIDHREFAETYGSNHIHCIQGDYVDDLLEFCTQKGIQYRVY